MQAASSDSSMRPQGSPGKQPILKRSNDHLSPTVEKVAHIVARLAEVAEDRLPLNHPESKARIRYDQMNKIYWDSGPLTQPTNQLIHHDNKNIAQRHSSKNRYPNILPYDDHIWKPQHAALPEDFFLNASPFDEGDRLYVSTQGPLEGTIRDFLSAVVLSGCRIVLTLANIIENDRVKTEPWWDMCKLPMPLYGGYSIQYIDEEEYSHPEAIDRQILIIRRFKVRDSENNDVREIFQIQHFNWKDHGAPDRQLFRETQERVDKLNPGKTPIVCHCSAGCGRAGTWIAADKIWRKIQSQLALGKKLHEIDIDIEAEIIQMRKIRAQMVQSVAQLKAIYEILLWRLRQLPC